MHLLRRTSAPRGRGPGAGFLGSPPCGHPWNGLVTDRNPRLRMPPTLSFVVTDKSPDRVATQSNTGTAYKAFVPGPGTGRFCSAELVEGPASLADPWPIRRARHRAVHLVDDRAADLDDPLVPGAAANRPALADPRLPSFAPNLTIEFGALAARYGFAALAAQLGVPLGA